MQKINQISEKKSAQKSCPEAGSVQKNVAWVFSG